MWPTPLLAHAVKCRLRSSAEVIDLQWEHRSATRVGWCWSANCGAEASIQACDA